MGKIFYDWNQFCRDCGDLAIELKRYEPYTIFGIPRGGLIVAVTLSHITGMKLVQHVKSDTVIVDDICQTGRTFNAVTHFLGPKYDYKASATLWVVKEEQARPNHWIRVKSKEDWVRFPWETKESSKYDGTIPDVEENGDYLTPEQLKEKGFDKTMDKQEE